ncbi:MULTISPECIES: hypothetical protein, partial [unclassified Bradyrhizobium]|uniref:hypothetical protein n=1 Tax=unclassified Bradyrhizobium TaxID=2631580 RepID=UPI001FFBF7E3
SDPSIALKLALKHVLMSAQSASQNKAAFIVGVLNTGGKYDSSRPEVVIGAILCERDRLTLLSMPPPRRNLYPHSADCEVLHRQRGAEPPFVQNTR